MRRMVREMLATVDPVTGDRLRPSEHFSRLVQGVIRRWSFIGAITAVTAVWWTHPASFHDPGLTHWNLAASYLALLIESAVGIGVFSQTLRDAVILRRVDRNDQAMAERVERGNQELRELHAQVLAEIHGLARRLDARAGRPRHPRARPPRRRGPDGRFLPDVYVLGEGAGDG